MRSILLILVTLTLNTRIYSQEQIASTFEGKHHMISKDELSPSNYRTRRAFTESNAPRNARSIAEWEPNEAVIIAATSQGFGIPVELIKELSYTVEIITLCPTETDATAYLNYFASNGVDTSNVSFHIKYVNSYWTRDYSPWYIAVDNEVAICDFPYNRPRPNDDAVPQSLASAYSMDIYSMNVEQTGGNYMCDGMGIAASTDLVLSENSLSEEEIKQKTKDFLGINNYHLIPDAQGEYIKHIDCWGKFLDVDKILIAEVPQSNEQYDDYEAATAYWKNQTSSYGTPYQIYRVPSPNGQPYTNSLIMNNKIMVPIVSGLGSSYNEAALQIYRDAMPGYEIIGISQYDLRPWEATDALHCRTHEMPDREMIHIAHTPLKSRDTALDEYLISAEVSSYGKHEITSVNVFYSINNTEYLKEEMIKSTGSSYSISLSSISTNSSVTYYIEATDSTGKVARHPQIGSADPHAFIIDESYVGLPTQESALCITAFPNPTSRNLFINLKSETLQNYTIELFDINGSMVYSNIKIGLGNNLERINVSIFPKGIYLLKVSSNEKDFFEKVVIH